jgi:hypothetical protein
MNLKTIIKNIMLPTFFNSLQNQTRRKKTELSIVFTLQN